MPRWLALSLAVLFALAAPAVASAQEEAGSDGYSFAQSVIVDVDGFWGRTFAAGGWEYAAPTVVPIEGAVETPCGTLDAAWGPGFYCPPDGTIYLSAPFADQAMASGNEFAWVTVVAHEWGHHVQLLLGIPFSGVASEQQADCLAGAYLQDAAARGVVDPAAVTEAVRLSALSGDASWLPEDAPGAHGSGAERAQAVLAGYQGGVGGCGIAL